jgi:hypothetical protein
MFIDSETLQLLEQLQDIISSTSASGKQKQTFIESSKEQWDQIRPVLQERFMDGMSVRDLPLG